MKDNLILMVLASVNDSNIVNIKDEVVKLVNNKPKRWEAIYNWFKKKLFILLTWSLSKFPEVKSLEKIYFSLEALSKYNKDEMQKVVLELLDGVITNFEEIEKQLLLKEMIESFDKQWPLIIEAWKSNSYDRLKELGLNLDSPKELIESLETKTMLMDDQKVSKRLVLLLSVMKSYLK